MRGNTVRFTVRFSFDTEKDYKFYKVQASKRGLSLSGFAKHALYSYVSKHPVSRDQEGPEDSADRRPDASGGREPAA